MKEASTGMENGRIMNDLESASGIFKKMLSDKNKMRSYIKEHETLSGFNDNSIIFVKPLKKNNG